MEIRSLDEFKNGWVCGDFEPSLFKNKEVEVMIRTFEPGHIGDSHFHKEATEYNILVKGELFLGKDRNVRLYDGSIWILKPGEKCEVEYKYYSTVVTIKTPSLPGDKYYKDQDLNHVPYHKVLTPEQLDDCRNWAPSSEDAELLFKAVN